MVNICNKISKYCAKANLALQERYDEFKISMAGEGGTVDRAIAIRGGRIYYRIGEKFVDKTEYDQAAVTGRVLLSSKFNSTTIETRLTEQGIKTIDALKMKVKIGVAVATSAAVIVIAVLYVHR
jgi:hypothetical protein